MFEAVVKATTGAVALALVSCVLSMPAAAQQDTKAPEARPGSPTFLTMRGGGGAGSWYIGSSVIATIVNQDVPNVNFTATPGSANRNLTDVQEGKVQYGLAVARSAVEAVEGLAPFKAKHDKVRAVMALYPLQLQIVARQNQNIANFRDLYGKRVSAGQRGFTTLQVFEDLMKLDGKPTGTVKLQYLNYADGNQQFQDRELDAVMALSFAPSPTYTELESLFPIQIVQIEDDLIEAFTKKYPGYTRGVIPGSAYKSVTKDTPTIVSQTLFVTSSERSDAEVYAITKAIYEKRAALAAADVAFANIGTDTILDGINIPLHPGAERYWREIGALKK